MFCLQSQSHVDLQEAEKQFYIFFHFALEDDKCVGR